MKHSKLILISFAIICLIAKYFDNIFDCQNSDYNCAWIAAALGAAASIGSSIFGSSASKKAIKKAQKLEDETHEQNQAFNLRRYNQDYGDTKAGQNLIRKANEYADNTYRAARGSQAVGNGTEASTAAAKERANKMVGDTIAGIGAQDTSRKEAAAKDVTSENLRYIGEQVNNQNTKATNIVNTASAASNAAMQIGSVVDSATANNTQKIEAPKTDNNAIDNVEIKAPEKPSTQMDTLSEDEKKKLVLQNY